MVRKLLATATLAMLGLLWLPAMASAAAPAYPAPPVTPESTVPAVVDAVSTAPEISSRTTDTVASLGGHAVVAYPAYGVSPSYPDLSTLVVAIRQ